MNRPWEWYLSRWRNKTSTASWGRWASSWRACFPAASRRPTGRTGGQRSQRWRISSPASGHSLPASPCSQVNGVATGNNGKAEIRPDIRLSSKPDIYKQSQKYSCTGKRKYRVVYYGNFVKSVRCIFSPKLKAELNFAKKFGSKSDYFFQVIV